MIGQLVDDAPALERLALPAYNWLNDNEHGVGGGVMLRFESLHRFHPKVYTFDNIARGHTIDFRQYCTRPLVPRR